MLLLTCVAVALPESGGKTIAAISIDLSAFGRRFAVSRSHLRRILETAYDKGLLTAPPRMASI